MYQHFKAIADASNLPIIIYNIPGRVVVEMTPETMLRLAEHLKYHWGPKSVQLLLI